MPRHSSAFPDMHTTKTEVVEKLDGEAIKGYFVAHLRNRALKTPSPPDQRT
jgi:hypothetical protein